MQPAALGQTRPVIGGSGLILERAGAARCAWAKSARDRAQRAHFGASGLVQPAVLSRGRQLRGRAMGQG